MQLLLIDVGGVASPDVTLALPEVPRTWHYAQEAVDEIHSIRDCIAALARSDMRGARVVHVVTAFDLEASNASLRSRGHRDWHSFCGSDNAFLAVMSELPITWDLGTQSSARIDT